MVRVARNLMAVREHPKYLIIRIMGLVREEVQESAKTLIARGQIGSVDDIWYLTFDEINHALEDPDDRPDSLIARGRSDIVAFPRHDPAACDDQRRRDPGRQTQP